MINEAKASGRLIRAGWDVENGYLYNLEVKRRSGVSDTVPVVLESRVPEGFVSLEGILSTRPLRGVGEHIRLLPEVITPLSGEQYHSEVHLSGYYGGVQYLRETKTRGQVLGFRLETEEGFIPVCCFGDLAGYLERKAKAGDFLLLAGRLQSREYFSKRQGKFLTSHEVAAWHVEWGEKL